MSAGEVINRIETTIPDMPELVGRLGELAVAEGPQLINVGGASASGKSTISQLLARALPDAQVLSIDAYLTPRLWDQTRSFNHDSPDPERPYIGGISPEIWDLDLLEEHVQKIREGQSIHVPIFDETKKDRIGYEPFKPSRYVILEGGHSFTERFHRLCGFSVLVEAPLHDRLTRKMIRTHITYGLDDVDEVVNRYLTKDEPVRKVYAAEDAARADHIVQNPANPARDYAHMRPSKHSSPPGGTCIRLTPTPETGNLAEGEEIHIVHTDKTSSWVTYTVRDAKLVQVPISRGTEGLLGQHYDFTYLKE